MPMARAEGFEEFMALIEIPNIYNSDMAVSAAGRNRYVTYTVDGIQPASGGARVTGRLTVRGRTRPPSFDAQASAAASEVRLDAEVPVNRADFGLTYSPTVMASMNNTITVRAIFTRQ
jgi:polyisoprenoid-binding protein YceI